MAENKLEQIPNWEIPTKFSSINFKSNLNFTKHPNVRCLFKNDRRTNIYRDEAIKASTGAYSWTHIKIVKFVWTDLQASSWKSYFISSELAMRIDSFLWFHLFSFIGFVFLLLFFQLHFLLSAPKKKEKKNKSRKKWYFVQNWKQKVRERKFETIFLSSQWIEDVAMNI